MPLTNKDIEKVGKVVGKALAETVGDIAETLKKLEPVVNELHQTVYGAEKEKNGGLVSEVKTVRKRLRRVEAISYIWQGAITAVVAFKEKIFG